MPEPKYQGIVSRVVSKGHFAFIVCRDFPVTDVFLALPEEQVHQYKYGDAVAFDAELNPYKPGFFRAVNVKKLPQ
jgi:hypothetical protein